MSPVLAIGSSVKYSVDRVVSSGKSDVDIIVEYLGVVGRGCADIGRVVDVVLLVVVVAFIVVVDFSEAFEFYIIAYVTLIKVFLPSRFQFSRIYTFQVQSSTLEHILYHE